MAYKEVNMWVPSSKYSRKCPYGMSPSYITVHNTANDASARNEASYMRNNNNQTSFHDVVDDKEVVHCIPHNRNAWHAGDGGSGTGNRKSIGIEICYSKSGGSRFTAAEKNAAAYIATLLKQKGWGISRVKRHKDWSGKNCPHRTMALGWQRFLNMISAEMGGSSVSDTSSAITSAKTTAVDGSWGIDCTYKSQKVFGTTADGIVSYQPKSNKKYLANCYTGSWKFYSSGYSAGSELVRAIQKLLKNERYYTGAIDGWCGKQTVTAIQKFLKAKGLYSDSIDGSMGPNTVKGWQKYINSRV